MSLWSRTRTFLVFPLLISCASTARKQTAPPTYRLPTPIMTLPTAIQNWLSQPSNSDKSASEIANGIKSRMCADGRAKWSPTYRVSAFIPKPPSGTALDEATAIRERYVARIQKYLKSDLLFNISYDPKKNIPRHNLGEIDVAHGYQTFPQSFENIPAFFQSQETTNPDKYRFQVTQYDPILVVFQSSGKMILVPSDNSFSRYENYRSGFLVEVVKDACAPTGGNCVTTMNYVMDLQLLRDGYALFMSKEEQMATFENLKSHMEFPSKDYFGETYNPGEAPKFTIGRLLQESDEFWRAYFSYFTTLKESPGAGPDFVTYDISLNLDTFCKYGRPKVDLMSN